MLCIMYNYLVLFAFHPHVNEVYMHLILVAYQPPPYPSTVNKMYEYNLVCLTTPMFRYWLHRI